MNNLQCVPYVDIDFCINNLIFSSSSAVSGHKCKWSHNVITTKNLTRKSRRQKHDWVRTKWSEAPQSTASSRGGNCWKVSFYFQLFVGPERNQLRGKDSPASEARAPNNVTCLIPAQSVAAEHDAQQEPLAFDQIRPNAARFLLTCFLSSRRAETCCPSQIVISTLLTDNIAPTNPLADMQSIRLHQLQTRILI